MLISSKSTHKTTTIKQNHEKKKKTNKKTESDKHKKRGKENPSKNIRVVLWNETHRFEKNTPPIVLRIIYASKAFKKQGADAVVFEFPSHDIPYYKALAEVRRKFDKRIFFYFKDEQVLKEIKKWGQW